ncbi:TetR/AcrR family transcriptional regulator [Paenibacillus sp. CC-CFT747]|nr:TetR/AcrR family transcriptional regulator [Paenibacillus sp. CC-CFT747]
MNGFEKRAQGIKNKIKQTTFAMLQTAPDLKGMRIADIAKEARVSQVTIYNYFGSKEALLTEVIKDYAEKSIRDFEAYLNEGHTLKEKIEHILSLEKASYKELPPGLIKEMMEENRELDRFFREQYQEKTLPLTMRIVQEGKESGEISEKVSAEQVMALMQLYMNQYELVLGMAAQSEDREGFLEGIVHMFFYGICGKP